jgi:hypothetical protein
MADLSPEVQQGIDGQPVEHGWLGLDFGQSRRQRRLCREGLTHQGASLVQHWNLVLLVDRVELSRSRAAC